MERLAVSVLDKVRFSPKTFLERRLLFQGEIKVNIGDIVEPFTIIGECRTNFSEVVIPLCRLFGIDEERLYEHLTKRVGEGFGKGEIIARKKGFLGFGLKIITAPFSGVLTAIDRGKGEITLSTVPEKVILTAGAAGKIVDIVKNKAVLLEISATQVQGVWSMGAGAEGELVVVSPFDVPIELNKIKPDHKGKIVAGGSFASGEVLRKAAAIGVSGIVCGGINYPSDDFLKDGKTAVLVTEGFGMVPMVDSTWHYLKSVEARTALISPERKTLLIPETLPQKNVDSNRALKDLSVGDRVQIFSWPDFGRTGQLTELVESASFPSGITAPGVKVQLSGNKGIITVPYRNVGCIE